MTISAPSYVPIDEISQAPIEYEWDDWDPYEVLGNAEETTLDSLADVSDRGVVTFAIGCSEWVVYRLHPHLPDDRAFHYLEVCWALVMGAPVALPCDPVEKEWKGKFLSPVGLSLLTILNAWRMAEDGQADAYGGFAERIPLHVVKDFNRFIAWRDSVLPRLVKFHPYDDKDESMGNLVAREILDPRIDLLGIDQNELVSHTLSTIDITNNPFVRRI